MEKLSRIKECMVICEYLTNQIKDANDSECISETNSLIGVWCEYQNEMLEIEKIESKRINEELANMKDRIDKFRNICQM